MTDYQKEYHDYRHARIKFSVEDLIKLDSEEFELELMKLFKVFEKENHCPNGFHPTHIENEEDLTYGKLFVDSICDEANKLWDKYQKR
jgi:hypothetical protein